MVEFLQGITGWQDFNMDEVVKSGKRIQTLRQSFNVREGFEPGSFELPGRLVGNPPTKDEPVKDIQIDYKKLRKEYYNAMGWNEDTGVPLYDTITELELNKLISRADLRL